MGEKLPGIKADPLSCAPGSSHQRNRARRRLHWAWAQSRAVGWGRGRAQQVQERPGNQSQGPWSSGEDPALLPDLFILPLLVLTGINTPVFLWREHTQWSMGIGVDEAAPREHGAAGVMNQWERPFLPPGFPLPHFLSMSSGSICDLGCSKFPNIQRNTRMGTNQCRSNRVYPKPMAEAFEIDSL